MYKKYIAKQEAKKGFGHYVNRFLLPYLRMTSKRPDYSAGDLNADLSLLSVEHFILESDNIYLIHNADDEIIMSGATDVNYFLNIFGGNRTTIYPHGGHLGNLLVCQKSKRLFANFILITLLN